YSADASGAQAVVDATVGRAGGTVGLAGGLKPRSRRARPALRAQRLLERHEAGEHVLARRRVAHRPDAPDAALQRPEGRADLDPEVVDELGAHAQLVDPGRHDDGRDEGQATLRWLGP